MQSFRFLSWALFACSLAFATACDEGEEYQECTLNAECPEGQFCESICIDANSCLEKWEDMFCEPDAIRCVSEFVIDRCGFSTPEGDRAEPGEEQGCPLWSYEVSCDGSEACFSREAEDVCQAPCASNAICGAGEKCQMMQGYQTLSCMLDVGDISADDSCELWVGGAQLGPYSHPEQEVEWDTFGLPDPLVEIEIDGQRVSLEYFDGTREATWNEVAGTFSYAAISAMRVFLLDHDEPDPLLGLDNPHDVAGDWGPESGRWYMGNDRDVNFQLVSGDNRLDLNVTCAP